MTFHHFSIDVEEYFHVSAFEPYVRRAEWDRFPSRVAVCVARMLDLLARHEALATFFILGWVAERHPDMVRTINRAGHEVASHGWDHARVTEIDPAAFRESVRRTKLKLEELTGEPVLGFRAPSYSIVPGGEWALDVLLEEGYRYDSSLFPVRRGGGYGYPGAKRDPYWIERPGRGRIAEIPPATLRWAGLNVPAGGGGYFRLLPYALTRQALRECERRGAPGTFYIHPWEIDPNQPHVRVPWLTYVRHYGGLARTEARLERLLLDFRFVPIRETVGALEEPACV
jgi:polysaccharide deacetylase family protein (PEP-CTERM system associated)